MQTLSVDQLVGQTLGSYRVELLLGQGRLNAVYLARNLFEQRTDALTLYLVPERFSLEARQRFLVRFLKEAAAISSLKHQHILPVCEYSEHGGFPYLVTPYMTNGSLADVIKQRGRCSHTDVMNILEQVGSGLEYAHRRGHIHGMLRPSNIVLNNDGSMLVAGFGLMHMLQMSGIDQTNRPYAHLLSVVETFMIAPAYVAPEIVQGQAIDRRSDVYALGAILFEMLSGRPPFTGEGTMEVAMQHVNQPAPSLRSIAPDVPVVLASVISQALEREPDRRFQRVSELLEAFAQASKGVTGELSNMAGSRSAQRLNNSKEVTSERQTGSWQLLPPIVTGKLSSIPSSSSTNLQMGDQLRKSSSRSMQRLNNSKEVTGELQTGSWQLLPPIVTGKPSSIPSSSSANLQMGNQPRKSSGLTGSVPVQRVPAPAPVPTQAPAQVRASQNAPAPFRTPKEPWIQPMAAASASVRPEPAKQEPVPNGMQPFDWWSMPGQFQDVSSAPGAAKEAAPAQSAEPDRQQGILRLSDTDAADPWGMDIDPMMSSSSRLSSRSLSSSRLSSRSRSRRRSGGMQRRQVVALLAGGGVLAAGGAVAFALTHGIGVHLQATTTQHTTTASAPVSKLSPTAPHTNTNTTTAGNKQTTPAGHTGTVIAESSIPINSAVYFTNPTTDRSDVLVHLPNGQFVAYDRACTHQQVLINYDPNTHMMICPLHGSIFNPANNGNVMQGPATTPVAMVPIKVNADGTVTTA